MLLKTDIQQDGGGSLDHDALDISVSTIELPGDEKRFVGELPKPQPSTQAKHKPRQLDGTKETHLTAIAPWITPSRSCPLDIAEKTN